MKKDFIITQTSICEFLHKMLESLSITPLERLAVERLYLDINVFPSVEILSSHSFVDMIDVRSYLSKLLRCKYLCSLSYRLPIGFDIEIIERLWCISDENVDDNVD